MKQPVQSGRKTKTTKRRKPEQDIGSDASQMMETPTKVMKLDAEAEDATTLSTVDHSPLSTTSDVRQMETPSKSTKIDSEAEDDTTPTKIDLSPLCNLSTIEEESLILDESMRDEVKENTEKLDSSISTDCEQERASVHIEVNNESDIEDRENGNETATDDSEKIMKRTMKKKQYLQVL